MSLFFFCRVAIDHIERELFDAIVSSDDIIPLATNTREASDGLPIYAGFSEGF
ncbi:hypothetical protein [Microbulbifer sp. THAF38]|uniref:hypothetical protein n=1 Tax=Microbulbifer sp. THAF38 TaxID=2587856 RepID=UPI0012AA238A|nr:hypothetical protein [Microbulbifer sp. THAF38]QFT55050.1 hypothetical protein FIU95_10830 [Microbulbifer sp. THAF38]